MVARFLFTRCEEAQTCMLVPRLFFCDSSQYQYEVNNAISNVQK